MSAATEIANAICATVLVLAGALKIGQLRMFGQQVAAYQVIPKRLSPYAGYSLPPAEIIIGLALPLFPDLAVAAIVLFGSFAVAVGVNLVRGRNELRCGCFGVTGSHTISKAHVIGNGILMILAAATLVTRPRFAFVPFQVGVSFVLIIVLLYAWRTMRQTTSKSAEEAIEA